MSSLIAYYLDTSAMAKLYAEESGSARMLELVEAAPPGGIAISRLTLVEVTSALVRRSRCAEISEEDLQTALGLVDEDTSRFQISELGGAAMSRAISLIRKHGLRAADAIQLASALLAGGDRGAGRGLTLVSSDRELNAAAEQEGLAVLDPTDA